MPKSSIRIIVAAGLTGLLASSAGASGGGGGERAEYIRSHYTKFEYRIPMRDGVRLHTAVYQPRNRSKRYPILLNRTPYAIEPYGPDEYAGTLGPTAAFEEDQFIFVMQDVRGRFMSEGKFLHMRPHQARKRTKQDIDESTDTHDTIAWLLKRLEGHNGKVGMWGISYPGFYCSAGMIDSHPALKAVSPQAPIADWYWDDVHHHGAVALPLAFFLDVVKQERDELTTKWPDPFDFGTKDGFRFFMELGSLGNIERRYFKGKNGFWSDVAKHPDYDDFWKARNILPHLKRVRAAVLVVGGWFDNEDLYGPLKTYQSVERQNPRASNKLVMGPWAHGGWQRMKGDELADQPFGFETSTDFQARVALPFFKHHLKGGPDPDLPEAYAFETGANRWRRFDRWPPKGLAAKRLHFAGRGKLSFETPPSEDGGAHDAFVSDPAKPVPFTMRFTPYGSKVFLAEDQRFAGYRPDVLVYETEPLEQDVTIAGPMRANLWVSTSREDADWVVKLVDVWPGKDPNKPKSQTPWSDPPGRAGLQALVRAEVMRGRYREAYDKPRPFEPGKVAEVSFELLDILHTFKRGHRIMVQVQSSWFPYVDRNPQSWVPNVFEAEDSQFVAATHRVHRSKSHPSHIVVGVLIPLDQKR